MRMLWMTLLLAVAMLTSCAPPAAKVELRFLIWGDIPEIEMLQRVVRRFEASHPGVDVRLEHPPNYLDFTLVQSQEDPAPDVISVEISHLRRFLETGILLELDDLAARDPEFHRDAYHAGILNFFTRNSRLYAVPRDVAPHVCVYYNQALFDAAGVPYPENDWSWPKDFVAKAQALTRRDAQGRVTCYGFMDDWPAWETFMLSNGGRYVDANGPATHFATASSEALEALQFRHDLMYHYRVMPNPTQAAAAQELGGTGFFLTGKTAMFFSGWWKAPYFRNHPELRWDVAPFPQGPHGPRRFSTGGTGYGIARRSAHPREAWQLVAFLTGREGQTIMAQSGLVQPALTEIACSRVFLDGAPPRNKAILLQAADQVVFPPDTETWSRFMAYYFQPAVNQAWNPEPGDIRPILVRAVQRATEDLLQPPISRSKP